MLEDPVSIQFPCIKASQPIGEFFIASISFTDLCKITHFDVRRILKERDVETYLGIQRPLNRKRVEEIKKYVNTYDAVFPTAIIVAVDERCAEYNENSNVMTLSNYMDPEDENESILFRQIAKVLDGQHRLAGLEDGFDGNDFDVNVSIFISIDISAQANIFSTVNLAQTKVNKSLAYDLFDLAKAKSPQKSCHNIAVALDQNENSPFYHKIKRLGVSTEGRFTETITQATFVQSLMPYISYDPMIDRDIYLRGKNLIHCSAEDSRKYIFRNMFIDDQELEIADIIWNYYSAIKNKWNRAWTHGGEGLMLNKTNGFKAFMRFLKPVYLFIANPGDVPSIDDFTAILNRIDLGDDDFNVDTFRPGTSGEASLYRELLQLSRLE